MSQVTIRDAVADDFSHIVALNRSEVLQTSPMDLESLRDLARLSSYHTVAVAGDRIAAFLLAMRENSPYENENYSWFAARFRQFIYVDRIVVGANFAGKRIGSFLYKDLFAFARSRSIKTIVCEYNIQPPNFASKRFHDKFGFKELGTQWVANGTKLVTLQAAEI